MGADKLRQRTWFILGGIVAAYFIAIGGQYLLYQIALDRHGGYLRGNVRLLQQVAGAAAQSFESHAAAGHTALPGGVREEIGHILSQAIQPMNGDLPSYAVRAILLDGAGRMVLLDGSSAGDPPATPVPPGETVDDALARALQGHTGTDRLTSTDGALALTAYAPLPAGLGAVAASIALGDIRQPFVITGGVIAISSLPVLLLAVGLLSIVARRTQEHLQHQELQAQAILDGLTDGILSFDPAGRCVSANTAALKILGEAQSQVPSHDRLERRLGLSVLPNCSACADPCGSCERPIRSTEFIDDGGEVKYVDVQTIPLRQDGQLVGAIMRLTDVTALAEAQRREFIRHKLDGHLAEFANRALLGEDVPLLLQDTVEVIEEAFQLIGVDARLSVPGRAEPLRWPERPLPPDGDGRSLVEVTVGEQRGFLARLWVPRTAGDDEIVKGFCSRVAEILVIAAERLFFWREHLEQEKQYKQVIEDTADALCRFDSNGRISFANGAYARLVGLAPKDCIGENFYERIVALCDAGSPLGDEDWPRVFDTLVATASEEEVWYRWTVSRVTTATDGDYLQASGKDVTELRRSRLALEQRERILSATHSCSALLLAEPCWNECTTALLEHIGRAAGVTRSYTYRVDNDAGCIVALDEWVADGFDAIATRVFPQIPLSGGGFDGVLRVLRTGRYAAFRPADVAPHVRDHLLQLGVKTLVAIPIVVRQQWWGLIGLENSKTDSDWSPVCLEGLQSIANALGSAVERQLALDELVDRERFVNSLMHTIPEAVIVVDRQGIIVHWNRGATLLFGEAVDGAVGTSVDRFMVTTAGLHDVLADAAATGSVPAIPRTAEMRHADGTSVPVEVSIGRWLRDSEPLFSLIVRDIRHRLNAERQLRQAQKAEALGNLAGGIAHDFNNLLVPIVSLSDFLLDDRSLTDDAREPLEMIRKAAEEARHLVRRILTFARDDAGEGKVWDLAQVTRDALAILASTIPTSVDVRFDVPKAPVPVRIRKALFHAALFNLVSNAVHAIGQGTGRIEIALAGITAAEGDCRRFAGLEERRSYARLVVKDTGHGMDAATLSRIFDPYFTTKGVGEGSGLGLMMVHDVVHKHGGHIAVESREGEGATFTIHLPLELEAEVAMAE